MNEAMLTETVRALLDDNKGLLAMDESIGTCNKHFAALGIPQTEEMRRSYREMILTTPGLNESISGAILFDQTIRARKLDGTPFIKVLIDANIIPGIKVDFGAKAMKGFPGEKLTEGLDGLPARLKEYSDIGARFAKWRAVMAIGNDIPTPNCIKANAIALAQYAKYCQQAGLVPTVEPEVLMDGNHSLKKCMEVTEQVLQTVFEQLYKHNVLLSGMLLKPNMILPGLGAKIQDPIDVVAEATVNCLLKIVPKSVLGVAFLSGGQDAEVASARLNAMQKKYKSQLPWTLTFSFGRALQQPALEKWLGKNSNISAAQRSLKHRSKCNRAANMGHYNSKIEQAFWQEDGDCSLTHS
ncbi:fructose-bisphosphate aldolase class I [Pedobacter sp. UYEF25]